MQNTNSQIISFILITTVIIFFLAGFIVTLIYLYQKKQLAYQQNLDTMRLDHEKNLLKTQVEMQENTFENISREIHDNINLSLTLAKLNLNTINWNEKNKSVALIHSSIDLLSKAINDLSDISKSMNPEVISNQGLINAIEKEIEKIKNIGLFGINFLVTGNPIFLDAQKELIIFRIIQESLNNVIKHAHATQVGIELYYDQNQIDLTIHDNGKGFSRETIEFNPEKKGKAGLNNMRTRAKMFNGNLTIDSLPQTGTNIFVTIPY
jgi:two-component system NarL family sensor kinase